VLFAVVLSGFAADSADVALTPIQQARFDSICSSFRIASCDSVTITAGLKRAVPCPIAAHLSGFAQWLVFKEKSNDELKQDLSARQECLASSKRFSIDLKELQVAGDPKAPVTIVAYISALCPLCKFICSELFMEVTSGKLKGKAKLAAKSFTETAGDRALLAAAHYSKFWDFIQALNAIKMRPDEPILLKVADSLGISLPEFRKLLSSEYLQATLVRCHDEGVHNEVSITPIFFINGKRYRSYKDPRWIIDAALYEYSATVRIRPHYASPN
jgi:hypothetical protein